MLGVTIEISDPGGVTTAPPATTIQIYTKNSKFSQIMLLIQNVRIAHFPSQMTTRFSVTLLAFYVLTRFLCSYSLLCPYSLFSSLLEKRYSTRKSLLDHNQHSKEQGGLKNLSPLIFFEHVCK